MPYVNIKVTDEGVSPDDRRALIAGATDLLRRVLGKDPNTTFVVIDEIQLENWGVGGLPVTEWREKTGAASIKAPGAPPPSS